MSAAKTRANENNEKFLRVFRAVTFLSPPTIMDSDETFNKNQVKHRNSRSQAISRTNGDAGNSLNRHLRKRIMFFAKLRIHILPDRRVFIAGKIPEGIYIPRNSWLQNKILERMILWYLPCLEPQGNVYSLNDTCYARKENQVLSKFEFLTSLKQNVPKPPVPRKHKITVY